MTPERYEQIGQIYHAALEREPAERDAFLAEACDDDEMRREVLSLIASREKAGDFIEQPPDDVAAGWQAAAASLTESSFAHYQMLSLLGKGGMGEVWLAEDSQLGRKVAVKLLPHEFTTDAGRVSRFAREARTASSLNHPNIVTIYEIGEAATESGTRHYIATEYVDGETLRQRMANAPHQQIPLPEALEVATHIAAALAAAHEAGIAHRDIKPENVMVRRDLIVKVLDFGLAKLTEPAALAADTQLPTLMATGTESGMLIGTPRYMSPEQASGEKVDARTDIFSLGVVLYEMIAGRAPFRGTTSTEVLASILSMALCGDTNQAKSLIDELIKLYPEDTIVNSIWVPVIHASIELQRGNATQAIDLLQPVSRYEAAAEFWPQYLRGLSYLKLRRGAEAAVEFQKIIDNRGQASLSPLYSLAYLGLARACVLTGETAKSNKARADFFAAWKDADPDLPILIEAKRENENR
jgi:serine/threonine protein kinase